MGDEHGAADADRVRRSRRGPVHVLVLAGLALVGCGEPAGPPSIRNVLLVTFDTTRADRLGCYGYAAAPTPRVDQLAAEGVRFARCISPSPLTLPAHASILTGQYPFRHGARSNATHVLAEDAATLAERLTAAGYDAGAIVSAFVLDGSYGLDQGFGEYDDDLSGGHDQAGFEYAQTTADDTARRALRWLAAHDEAPFFLWVHFYDPHRPFDPPEPWATRFAGRRHDGELAFTDAQLGTILDQLSSQGRLDQTLVVLTADHGESFGEHGERDHGLFVYEATTHVPLVFRHPALLAGRVVDEVVSSVDIAPTVLELLDLPQAGALDGVSQIDGVSLAELLLRPDAAAARRPVYSEAMFPYYNHGWSDLRALTDNAGRYIRAPRPELYVHATDPDELHSVLDENARRAEPYERALASLLSGGERDTRGASTPGDAELQAFAELGYLVNPAPTRPLADDLLLQDPKDEVGQLRELAECKRLLLQGNEALAVQQLEALLAVTPGSPEANRLLFEALVRLQRLEQATRIADELVAGPSPLAEDFINRAAVDRLAGRPSWEAALDAGCEHFPRDVRLRIKRGDWLVADGQIDDAVASYRDALALDDRSVDAWLGLARALARGERDDEARQALAEALRRGGSGLEQRVASDRVLSRLGTRAK